jgi:hypothetical protein
MQYLTLKVQSNTTFFKALIHYPIAHLELKRVTIGLPSPAGVIEMVMHGTSFKDDYLFILSEPPFD